LTCSTICYTCVYPVPYQGRDSGIICSDQVGSLDSFNSVIQTLTIQHGNKCYKISSDKSYKYCDNNDVFKKAVQGAGFICE